MQPEIHANYLAILVGVVANFVIGFIWYGPLFGKTWAKEVGHKEDSQPDSKKMLVSMGLMVIGSFLTAYVLTYTTNIWRASVWHVGEDRPAWVYGFFSGFYTWIGFYVPLLLNTVAFESRTWKLFGINAAYNFVSLQVVAMILSYWR
ncbi:DUF1761 domain-containing protein [Leptospira ellisii]|uniref:DUF1761 domain-containing protein n=1 Tax=Leptospira ellisii TaxID=2023197 RepID=A0A2N0BC96_9LEPT|nr:DUF1761 domain-containing protein [Leptospira ellisii]MDV6235770.1 DUF1761 domain-containing protein [Leptospira ellisii]PJZ94178.1 hypothetical protein CH379_04055 [Leptospira ellisii]PKA05262.1 hypothetical protein CH375_06135 [Leptospira ellisii]